MYQINTYQRPPDYLIYNTGRNFSETKFRQYTKLMAIKIKEVLIKAYNSVGKVEKYYTLLQ